MKVPTLPHLVLLFFLGGVFLYFMQAGARTLYFVRHPIYLSYMFAWLAAAVALPHWITATLLVGGTALFVHAARHDERTIARSPLAAAYAGYRERAGLFWPKFSRAAPGRSTP